MTVDSYNYSIERLCQHIGEAVLFYPSNTRLKLETFLYIKSESDLAPDNLSQDYRKAKTPYFVSKRQAKKPGTEIDFDFPLVALMEIRPTALGVFENNATRILNEVQIMVLDVNTTGKEITGTNADREYPEIILDCNTLLLQVLDYIKAIEYARIEQPALTYSYGYYHPEYLESLKLSGKIFNYISGTDDLSRGTNSFKENILRNNTNLEIDIIENATAKNLCGVSTVFRFETIMCETVEFDYSFAKNNFIYGNGCF